MRLAVITAALIVLGCWGVSAAATIEVPLPELVGTYGGPVGVTDTITVDAGMTFPPIVSVSVRVRGEGVPGTITCLDGSTGPWPMEFDFLVPDPDNAAYWLTGVIAPNEAGSFELVDAFRTFLGDATWDLFGDGTMTIIVTIAPPALIGVCSGVTPPTATITDAALLVNTAPVAVQPSTWGRVKALYR